VSLDVTLKPLPFSHSYFSVSVSRALSLALLCPSLPMRASPPGCDGRLSPLSHGDQVKTAADVARILGVPEPAA